MWGALEKMGSFADSSKPVMCYMPARVAGSKHTVFTGSRLHLTPWNNFINLVKVARLIHTSAVAPSAVEIAPGSHSPRLCS